jgi:hypothetical protein
MTGLDQSDLTNGRYIKVQAEHNDSPMTEVFCANNSTMAIVGPSDAADVLGDSTMVYSICTDKSGVNCEIIKEFNIKVSKNNDRYIAEPKLVELALATYANRYPQCYVGPNIKVNSTKK